MVKRHASGARFFRVSALLLAFATAAHAQSQLEEDFDEQEKPWQETAVQLPAAPAQENLLPFFVSAIATQSFAIDAKSVSVGVDGVVRYTLVATSQAGAKNISYEGIRCATYERKLYAFGQPDGSWSRSRRDRWEHITTNAANRQQAALFKDYFCNEKTVAGDADDIVRRIRYGRTLRPQ
ncbi:MAG TPA: CNP1-like family protein [Noviherbaspirillum sp.]|nr:CNP1-like family protein [Noviherbaspirillum sp.]